MVWLPLAKLAWLVIDTSYPDLELSYEVIINRIDIVGSTLGLKLPHPMVFRMFSYLSPFLALLTEIPCQVFREQ